MAKNKTAAPVVNKSDAKVQRTTDRKQMNRDRNEAARVANIERKEKGLPTARQARALKRASDPMVQQRKADHERARAKVLAEAKAKGNEEARKRRAERLASEAYGAAVLIAASETMRRIHAA